MDPTTAYALLEVASNMCDRGDIREIAAPPSRYFAGGQESALACRRVLRRRYELLDEVGRGGQSWIVRARDRVHGRTVAIKVRVLVAVDEVPSLLTEARVMLALEPHPNVAVAREDFVAHGHHHLVMDWIPGRSLRALLEGRRGAGFPVDVTVGWMEQIACALDHVHTQSPPIVHGDVNPGNIVVRDDGRATLVDFGISTLVGDRPNTHARCTPGYQAPEVASGGTTTTATDVFSFSATIVTLLTGGPPSVGRMPAWSSIPESAVDRVEHVLRWGLATNPARRPASAGELMSHLRTALE
jgi:eukaryotic-like serine/threonine-protein kinase